MLIDLQVPFEKAAALPQVPVGWHDYSYSVLADGVLTIVRTDIDIRSEYARWYERIKSDQLHVPAPAVWGGNVRISTFDGMTEVDSIEVTTGFVPVIDRLPNGNWLVVSTRTRGEKNARLFSSTGELIDTFFLGDAIEHLRCASDGTIWVGYFDEGVFASADENGNPPISSSGIASFASDGTILWSFNGRANADVHIADCYSLTLAEGAIWSCFYSGFPIVKIADGSVSTWSTPIGGVKALAIDNDFVLLAGGYQDEAGRIALLRLSGDQAELMGQVWFKPPERGTVWQMQGVGTTLHLISEGRWIRIDVADVRASLGF